MQRVTLTVTVLLSIAAALDASPYLQLRHRQQRDEQEEEEEMIAVDAGALDSCVTIHAGDLTVCPEVAYDVPEYVFRIAAAIQTEIAATHGVDVDVDHLVYEEDCLTAIRRIECSQRFPRCVTHDNGTKMINFSSLDCASSLNAACGIDFADGEGLIVDQLCGVSDSVLNIGECRSLQEHAEEFGEVPSEVFTGCNPNSAWKMTEWMYQYLKYYDQVELHRVSIYSSECRKRLANFTCQFVGRCSEGGDRVELANTRQQCDQAIECFSDAVADVLTQIYDCSLWPEGPASPPVTVATIPTSATTTSSSSSSDSSTTPMATWPSPPDLSTAESIGGAKSMYFIMNQWTLLFIVGTLHTLILYWIS